MFSIKHIQFKLAVSTVLTFGLCSSFLSTYAQEDVDPFKSPTTNTHSVSCRDVPGKNDAVIIDDSYPDYPGGIIAIRSFLSENIVYPSDNVEGKVYVSLTVDTSGRVTNVQIKKSLSPLADAEVVRVMKLMVFKPALVNGKPVNSRISLPCSFSLGKKD